MKRMSDETGVRSWLYVEEVEEQKAQRAGSKKSEKKAGKELSSGRGTALSGSCRR